MIPNTSRALLVGAAALAGSFLPASAQQRPAQSAQQRPAQPAAPAAPAQPRPAAPAAPAQPAPPPIFLCRTAEEVCHLGIVVGSQVAIIYTNAPQSQGIDEKPINVTGPDGAKIDMTANNGRVVMLTGTFDAKTGLTKAEVVEVASPLASLIVKAQIAGSAQQEEPAAAPPAAPPPQQRPAQPAQPAPRR